MYVWHSLACVYVCVRGVFSLNDTGQSFTKQCKQGKIRENLLQLWIGRETLKFDWIVVSDSLKVLGSEYAAELNHSFMNLMIKSLRCLRRNKNSFSVTHQHVHVQSVDCCN